MPGCKRSLILYRLEVTFKQYKTEKININMRKKTNNFEI